MPALRDVLERIHAKLRIEPDGCHIWTGAFGQKGMPVTSVRKKSLSARRVVWERAHGTELTAKQWITTTCGNHACLKPEHLSVRDLDPALRFWSYVDKSGGPEACWPWTGGRAHHRRGYGEFHYQDGPRAREKKINAHRMALILTIGPIADDIFACHRCDNPPCCNPAHLFPGTAKENNVDMWNKGRGSKGEEHGRRVRASRQATQPSGEEPSK